MNIYAIRDRLLDYYMQPFAGPGHKEVLAAIAQQVNGDDNNAIAKTPHHFEIWLLATINETGEVCPDKRLIADATSLVRIPLKGNRPGALQTPPDKSRGPGGRNSSHPSTPQPL